ncbi:MAG TPA: DUF4232 domain-containing protein [Gaiellales bacterium]
MAFLTTPPACHAYQLTVSLGQSEGAAGTTYLPIVFKNSSGVTCSLRGYPGVSSVGGDDGHQIGAAARRDPGSVRTIVLRSGASASATYGQVQALNYPKACCHPQSARGLRVYAPNVTAARYVPFKHLACSATLSDSHVRPIR